MLFSRPSSSCIRATGLAEQQLDAKLTGMQLQIWLPPLPCRENPSIPEEVLGSLQLIAVGTSEKHPFSTGHEWKLDTELV